MNNEPIPQTGPLTDGQSRADPPVAGWFCVGLLLGIIGLLIAYQQSPAVPADAIADYPDFSELQVHERANVEGL